MSLTQISKSVLLPYPVESVYTLVERIEDYPSFLPWCGGAQVDRQADGELTATIRIDYKGLGQSFTTRNRHVPNERIEMTLLDGPFTALDGGWQFKALADDGCKVQFDLAYQMRSGMIGRVLSPVFGKIADTMIDAFVAEAEKRYGPASDLQT